MTKLIFSIFSPHSVQKGRLSAPDKISIHFAALNIIVFNMRPISFCRLLLTLTEATSGRRISFVIV